MGMVNRKNGRDRKNFAHALRAVSFMLTYSEISAGALAAYNDTMMHDWSTIKRSRGHQQASCYEPVSCHGLTSSSGQEHLN